MLISQRFISEYSVRVVKDIEGLVYLQGVIIDLEGLLLRQVGLPQLVMT